MFEWRIPGLFAWQLLEFNRRNLVPKLFCWVLPTEFDVEQLHAMPSRAVCKHAIFYRMSRLPRWHTICLLPCYWRVNLLTMSSRYRFVRLWRL